MHKKKEESVWLQKIVERFSEVHFDPYIYPFGDRAPDVVPVFIEVSSGSRNKYEWDQDRCVLTLDRVLHSAVHYPHDYGFIPQTICGDGDPLDIIVMGTQPLIPGCIVYARPIAYMIMEDEKGTDEKVLAVLDKDPNFYHIKSFKDLSEYKLKEISTFFETYKKLEKDKWSKVGEWKDTEATKKLIMDTHEAFLKKEQEMKHGLFI